MRSRILTLNHYYRGKKPSCFITAKLIRQEEEYNSSIGKMTLDGKQKTCLRELLKLSLSEYLPEEDLMKNFYSWLLKMKQANITGWKEI